MRMKYAKSAPPEAEGDMTPMIDMTFQLVAFLMVMINFSEAEVDDRIVLPKSELAKPPEKAFSEKLTLQVTKDGFVIYSGDKIPVEALKDPLYREKTLMDRRAKEGAGTGGSSAATIIIRADRDAQTGAVQKVIRACQDVGFENFALAAIQA